ncbi:glycolipid 2-alpha-mannosyltransferase [Scheffersomyces amazonensis]|uniref:glycolipid 2-alpha-mannosyltransferase n=1 Tax=Scheffersomyces amazonensis TaxID=1078765 RepID=UPI00315D8147
MAPTRSNARLIRFGIFAFILIVCGFILTQGSSFSASTGSQPAQVKSSPIAAADTGDVGKRKGPTQKLFEKGSAEAENQKLDVPANLEWSEKDKIKATFVSLARNQDLYQLLESIRHIEDRFNHKFHYDWVFLNDQPFDDAFKEATSNLCSGKTKYGLIPTEHWSYPAWIDQEKAALARERMHQAKVIYGGSESYRHMCRYESGFFWRHDLMSEYEYYWRVEPDIKIYCDIDYDIFKWMKDNGKDYSFTVSLPEYKETIPTLWETTKKYIEANPKVLAENNLLEFISNDEGKTYNGCHFWSNFEIANLNFWRSDAYREYFEFLDRAGGFFYERWGDAPVHSIAAALFLPRDRIHFFEDVGYFHVPFTNCPVDPAIRFGRNCNCNPDKDFTWRGWSCTTKYYTVNNLKRQKNWEKYTS